jgi:hypothetical protein
MNENQIAAEARDVAGSRETERTKQVTVAGWTAGMSAFFAVGVLMLQPSWPTAVGVGAVALMIAFVCYFMLKR